MITNGDIADVRRHGRHRGGDRRRHRLVPRGRHGPRPADPPGHVVAEQPERHLPDGREQRVHRADQRDHLPDNPTTLGGVQNYTFFEPLPFIVLAQLVVGQEFLENTGGQTQFVDQPALHPARRR